MEEAGLTPEVLCVQGLAEVAYKKLLATTLKRQKITAVVCATDTLAYAVWDIAHDIGMRIPEDISLTGMDDLKGSAGRGLTSIRYSCEEVGRRSIEALIGLMQEATAKSVSSIVPVELVQRSSVALP
jgi:LacI family transcriptional regulator